jgi:hypothetical protein
MGVRPPTKKPGRGSTLNYPTPDLPIHPTDCGETSGIAGLPPWQPHPQRIKPKRPQSKGIEDLGPLGQELEQLEKPPNRGRFKGVLGAKSPAKEAQGPHT